MGVQNKITPKKYKELKKLIATHDRSNYNYQADFDKDVARKGGVSVSTVQKVRNTKSYQQYCERSFRFHGNPSRKQIIYRPNKEESLPANDRTEKMLAVVMLIIAVIAAAGITVLCVGLFNFLLGGAK